MDIASFKKTYEYTSLDDVINGLKAGLRADIPYVDTQTYTLARLTAVVVKGNIIDMFDMEYSSTLDTTELMLELESGVRAILEPNYDSKIQNGAGIVALLKV